jgi:hypothetical protein
MSSNDRSESAQITDQSASILDHDPVKKRSMGVLSVRCIQNGEHRAGGWLSLAEAAGVSVDRVAVVVERKRRCVAKPGAVLG